MTRRRVLQRRLLTSRRIMAEEVCELAGIDPRLFVRAVDANQDVRDRYKTIGDLASSLVEKLKTQRQTGLGMRSQVVRDKGANRQITRLVEQYLSPVFAGLCAYEMTLFCSDQKLPLPNGLARLLSVLLGAEHFRGVSEKQRMAALYKAQHPNVNDATIARAVGASRSAVAQWNKDKFKKLVARLSYEAPSARTKRPALPLSQK